tara:strand:+ start:314 stop:520 length:207 start_codon:yes stop_codon:yes gene_type:complete
MPKPDVTVTISQDGKTSIKGLEHRGEGSSDIHDLIDELMKDLGHKTSEQRLVEPNLEVDPIKKKLYRG